MALEGAFVRTMNPTPVLLSLCLCLPIGASAASWTVAQEGSADLVGNDHVPLRAAIAKAKVSGGEIVIKPGTYRIGQSLVFDGVNHVRLRGEGQVVLQLAPALVTELAAPVVVGDTKLVLRAAEGVQTGLKLRVLAPGDIIPITGKPKPTFETVVTEVAGTTVTLKEPLRYPAAAGTRVVNDNDLNLISIRGDSDGIFIENVTLDGGLRPDGIRQATHQTRCGVWIEGRFDYMTGSTGPKPRHLTVRDCQIRNFHGRGIAIYSGEDCLVEGCVIDNVLDEGIDIDHFTTHVRVAGNHVSHAPTGIELNDVNDSEVDRNLIEDCATGVKVWRYCKVEELNVRNVITDNRLRRMAGLAVDLQTGTARNIVRGNVVESAASTNLEKQFRDAGKENWVEANRVELK